MKFKLLIILTILAAQTSYAQLGAGNLMVGGALEISTNENQNSFTLSPTGYYFISDQLAIGGTIGFGTFRTNPGEDNYTRENRIGIIPSARYFWNLSEQVYVYGQGSLGLTFGSGKAFAGNTSTDTYNSTDFNIGLGTGLLYVISPKIGIDLGLNIVRFVNNSRTNNNPFGEDQTTTNNSFRFGINSFAPSFGLYYIF